METSNPVIVGKGRKQEGRGMEVGRSDVGRHKKTREALLSSGKRRGRGRRRWRGIRVWGGDTPRKSVVTVSVNRIIILS